MTFARLRAGQEERRAGRRLADSAVAQGRAPFLYRVLGAPDTVEGRFEILTLHVILLIDRLNAEAAGTVATRQALFDAYLGDLDGALREMGVGDLAVGKRMRKLGQAFYGRARAWSAALAALADEGEIRALLGRTVFDAVPDADSRGLAGYAAHCKQSLAGQSVDSLKLGGARWPDR